VDQPKRKRRLCPLVIALACVLAGLIANVWPVQRAAGESPWNLISSAETRYGWPLTWYIEFERGYIGDRALAWDGVPVPQYMWPIHGFVDVLIVLAIAVMGYIIPARWQSRDAHRKRSTALWRARTSKATAEPFSPEREERAGRG
jgi:hypothetical protein